MRAEVLLPLGLVQLHSPHGSFLLCWSLEGLLCPIPASHHLCHGNPGEWNHLEPSWALAPMGTNPALCRLWAGPVQPRSALPGLLLPSAVVPLTSYSCRVFHCLPWVLAVKVLNPP